MLGNDDAIAELAIAEALEGLEKPPWLWLRDSMYGSGEKNEAISSRIEEMQNNLGSILGWRLSVPDELVPRFVATCLGRDLMRSSSVRRLLVAHRASIDTDSSLGHLADVLKIKKSSPLEDVVNTAEMMSWQPSSNQAKRLVELLGLPPRYAEAGTSDDRPKLELVEPIKSLPDLLPSRPESRMPLSKCSMIAAGP